AAAQVHVEHEIADDDHADIAEGLEQLFEAPGRNSIHDLGNQRGHRTFVSEAFGAVRTGESTAGPDPCKAAGAAIRWTRWADSSPRSIPGCATLRSACRSI